jgi:hypothetical protein
MTKVNIKNIFVINKLIIPPPDGLRQEELFTLFDPNGVDLLESS